jgi:hypothetical protein
MIRKARVMQGMGANLDEAADFSDFLKIVRIEPCDMCVCESTHFHMDTAIAHDGDTSAV